MPVRRHLKVCSIGSPGCTVCLKLESNLSKMMKVIEHRPEGHLADASESVNHIGPLLRESRPGVQSPRQWPSLRQGLTGVQRRRTR